jgi:2-dehydrotetronate isomerase
MPKFAANLSLMFNEVEFLDRFDAAAKVGFKAVEFLFPYAFPPEAVAERAQRNGLTVALFNGPPGDWEKGERGMAALPGREAEFQDSIGKALSYARALGCERLHVMAGVLPPGTERAKAETVYVDNLRYAAREAAKQGVRILIEPLNTRDVPGYLMSRSGEGAKFVAAAGKNVYLQFDFYHVQIMEGDLARAFEMRLPLVGHVQIAQVPVRCEPDQGEINYPFLFAEMDRLGYRGWVGCEYRPRAGTLAGLGWARAWGIGST